MNKTITTLGAFVDQRKKDLEKSATNPNIQEDEHDMWAKLLATKVRKMDELDGLQFKCDVDNMALQYLKNK